MYEADVSCERRRNADGMERMGQQLHELCQPLTTLQCGLELAGLTDTPEAYRAAVFAALNECARVAERVRLMREMVLGTLAETEGGGCGKVPFVSACLTRYEAVLRIP